MLDAGLVDRIQHGLGLLGVAPQRLLAEDMLAGLSGDDAGLGVGVVGTAVVEQLDGRILQHGPPVRVVAFIAKALGRRRHCGFIATGHRHHLGNRRRRVHHVGNRLVGVAVGLAHEGIAKHTNANFGNIFADSAGCHRGETATFCHGLRSFL